MNALMKAHIIENLQIIKLLIEDYGAELILKMIFKNGQN